MNQIYSDENNNTYGELKISDDVVAIIAGVASTEIEGVAGMSGGITGGITEILGMKNLSKGVKVDVNENNASVDLFIIVDYGVKISEIAKKIQENVKESIETMTGLLVDQVNVNVQGVNFSKGNKGELDTKSK